MGGTRRRERELSVISVSSGQCSALAALGQGGEAPLPPRRRELAGTTSSQDELLSFCFYFLYFFLLRIHLLWTMSGMGEDRYVSFFLVIPPIPPIPDSRESLTDTGLI